MIYVGSILKIVDNTGAFYALCIRILRNSKLSKPGDTIVVSIKSVIYNKKVLFQKKRKVFKGDIKKAVLLRNKYTNRRSYIYLSINSNAAALIGK